MVFNTGAALLDAIVLSVVAQDKEEVIPLNNQSGHHNGYILECCVDSVESALAAKKGGADRAFVQLSKEVNAF